jgi:hypothetical protein
VPLVVVVVLLLLLLPSSFLDLLLLAKLCDCNRSNTAVGNDFVTAAAGEAPANKPLRAASMVLRSGCESSRDLDVASACLRGRQRCHRQQSA